MLHNCSYQNRYFLMKLYITRDIAPPIAIVYNILKSFFFFCAIKIYSTNVSTIHITVQIILCINKYEVLFLVLLLYSNGINYMIIII